MVEAKGKDRDEIGFFAKFVLCSNNEHLPVIIDAGETRYWVRKIVPLRSDDTDFLQKLKAEIPAFLYFLCNRTLSTEKESRMWFNPKLLETEALRKIIRSNRNRLEIEMAELLLDIMAKMEVGTVSFCLNDIIPLLVCSQVKVLFERHHPVARLLASQGGEVTGSESGAGVLEADTCAQRSYLYRLPIRRHRPLPNPKMRGQVLHRHERTAGKALIFC